MCMFFFFFKQKTAYEMRISDWSSDVCSSDLFRKAGMPASRIQACAHPRIGTLPVILLATTALAGCATTHKPPEISYDNAAPAVQTVDPPAPVTSVAIPRPPPLPGPMKPVARYRQATDPAHPANRKRDAE